MSRVALVLANSVTSPSGVPGVRRPLVKQTANSIASALERLPGAHGFNARTLVDERPNRVLTVVDQLAVRCNKTDDVFLFYYFGHGRLIENELEFIHYGSSKKDRE